LPKQTKRSAFTIISGIKDDPLSCLFGTVHLGFTRILSLSHNLALNLGDWCGTKIHKSPLPNSQMDTERPTKSYAEAKKAFHSLLKDIVGDKELATIQPKKDGNGMSTEIEKILRTGKDKRFASEYPCITQASIPVTIPANPNSDPFKIWIGFGGKISRWQKGSVVNFAAFAGGYPTADQAVFAAYRLYDAANKWNSLNVGVQFKWVSNLQDAEFVLAYGGDQGNTLAMAFFPNTNDLNTLYVYKRAFDPDTINFQPNIFEHELGHALGLRHEFAAQEGGAVQFGLPNPHSVMSYEFPPQIQKSDVDSTRAFYNFTGSQIGGLAIEVDLPDN